MDDALTHNLVDWGRVNQPFSTERFDALLERVSEHLRDRELFAQDLYCGADPAYRLPIRVISEYAWHSLFVRQLFVRPDAAQLAAHVPEFTVIAAPEFEAVPERDGTRSGAFILADFSRQIVLIGGTKYAGEMKKSIFGIMNFLVPQRDVLPMHCSANVGADGVTALFFGLSGTGKTTLSADPARRLIGDDEHGWSASGHLQLRGRLLCQVRGPDRRKRAADLPRHPLRVGAGECDPRRDHAPARLHKYFSSLKTPAPPTPWISSRMP